MTATSTSTPNAQAADLVLSNSTRPSQADALSAVLTFGWRAVLKIKHVPEQLGDVIGIPIMFTLLFTYLFGGALAGSTANYLQYLLPGSLVMAVMMVTIYSGVGLNTDVATGVFDRFRSLPIWRPAPIVGGVLGDGGRYLAASVIVIGLGLILGFRPEGGVVGVFLAMGLVLAFSLGLTWVWTTLALILRTPNAVMNLGMLILFPLTFASNVFVDPETTPGWLQAFIDINPVTHLVTAVRSAMHGTVTGGEVTVVFIASSVLAVVFAPLTIRLYATKC
jgi:ABC-2 type transport system permease protein